MSRLEQLIAELCPDGVELKNIGDICETVTDYVAAGSFADLRKNVVYSLKPDFAQLIRTTDLKSNFSKGESIYVSERAFNFLWRVNLNEESIILPNIGNCGEVYYVVPENLPYENNVLGPNAILVRSNVCDNKFLSYIFRTREFQMQLNKITSSTGQTKFNKTEFKKLVIPVPPLPVQQEIVRILDNFTELKTELTVELTAELTARRKQYKYYRDLLLTYVNEDTVKWISLKECTLPTSNIKWSLEDELTSYKYIDLTSVDRDLHYIIETQEINKNNAPSRAQQIVKTGDILFATTRPLLKRYCLVDSEYDEQICSTGFCVLRANTNIVLQKWILYHIASSSFYYYVEKYQQGASYPAISDTNVKNYQIPVPPLEEQGRIVAILDRFDALCNDLTSGLTAEVEERQKQYEYYRDRLLIFNKIMEE